MIYIGGCEALTLGQFEIFTFEVGYPTQIYLFTSQLLNIIEKCF